MDDLKQYAVEGLNCVGDAQLLSQDVLAQLNLISRDLQINYEKQEIWRTKTLIEIAVLTDTKFPTPAAKYWQCVRKQTVFFEQLILLSFEYKRNEAKLKMLNRKIEKLNANKLENIEDLEFVIESSKIDAEECLFKRKNMQIQAKDRVREIIIWQNKMQELRKLDPSFNCEDPNDHQLISYTRQFLLDTPAVLQSNNSDAINNHVDKLGTAINKAINENVIEKVLQGFNLAFLQEMNKFGFNLIPYIKV